jgi:hypothetical protein
MRAEATTPGRLVPNRGMDEAVTVIPIIREIAQRIKVTAGEPSETLLSTNQFWFVS